MKFNTPSTAWGGVGWCSTWHRNVEFNTYMWALECGIWNLGIRTVIWGTW